MTLLHGSWLADGRFLLWGEVWRRTEPWSCELPSLPVNPYSLSRSELLEAVQLICPIDLSESREQNAAVALPSLQVDKPRKTQASRWLPVLAGEALPDTLYLSPWLIKGIVLPASQAIDLLAALPLTPTTSLGDDLRYWSHVYRWSLSLLERGRYFPTLVQQGETQVACWQPLLEGEGDRPQVRAA